MHDQSAIDEWNIYQLLDPRTHEPHYVGITQWPLAIRYSQHNRRRDCGPLSCVSPLNAWMYQLQCAGLAPLMRRLAFFEGTKAQAEETERYWIALVEAKFAKQPLLNVRRNARKAA